MGQKINPISLRLKNLNRYFDSCWYTNHFYSELFQQDLKIQKYLQSIFKQIKFPTSRLFLQSTQKKVKIFNFFCNPLKGRRLRSYYFRRKYHKISKKLYFRKNKISKFLLGGNNSSEVLPPVQSSIKRNIFKQISITKPKKVNLKNILYQKYFNTFYTYQNLNQKSTFKSKWIAFFDKKENYYINNSYLNLFPNYYYENNLFNQKECSSLMNECSLQVNNEINVIKKKVVTKKIEKNLLNLCQFYEKSEKLKKNSLSTKLINPSSVNFDFKESVLKISNKTNYLSSLNIYNFFTLRSPSVIMPVNIPFNYLQKNSEWYLFLKNNKLDFYKNGKQIPYRKHMETVLEQAFSSNINIETIKTYDHFRSASFLAEEIVYYLEQRIPFRRIKSKLLKEIELLSNIKGIRITCSGRVGGRSKKAQRAKTDLVKYGETSLHVFSSFIDFSSKKALTSFGLIGIKVWICYTT